MKKSSNLFFGILNTVINTVFPIITLPYIFNTLGSELYGQNLHASLISQLLCFLFVGAINAYAIRRFTHAVNETVEYKKILGIQIVCSVLAMIVHILIIFIFQLEGKHYYIYIIVTSLSFLNVEWYFQAKQKYFQIFFRTFLTKTFILIFLVTTIKDKTNFELYVYVMSISFLLPWLISFYITSKEYGLGVSFNGVYSSIREAKHFYSNALIGSAYKYLDQIVIGMFITSSELAIVNLLKTIITAIVSIPALVSRFILPDALKACNGINLLKHHRKYFSILMVSLILGCTLFVIFGKDILNLIFNGDPKIKTIYIYLISLTVIVSSISIYIDNQCSIVLNLEKITSISNLFVGFITGISMFLLYDKFLYLSPILGLIIGETTGVIIMCLFHIKYYKTLFYRKPMK